LDKIAYQVKEETNEAFECVSKTIGGKACGHASIDYYVVKTFGDHATFHSTNRTTSASKSYNGQLICKR
jgi:hypothetical protein